MRRSVFLAGALTTLLLVIAGLAAAVWSNARSAQERSSSLHSVHVATGAALATIRSNVYLAAILTRDYLLDPDPTHAREYVAQFATIQKNTEDAFQLLEASGQDEQQKKALQQLRDQLADYWDPTEIVLDWTPEEKRTQRTQMLRQRVRQRQEAFALATQLERLMTDNFIRERERIKSADQEFRWSIGWIAAIAMLLGLGIAAVTVTRMSAMEKQSTAAEARLRLLSTELRTAQERERKYLSRELHDQVGQMLTGVRMELASMARLLADSESELSSRIARAKGTVEQTLRIVRNIAMLLRPSMLDDLGLTPAITWLVKEISRSSGIEITADIERNVDSLPDAHRTCLFRVVQEALTNVARHSGAQSAQVTVAIGGDWVVCRVSDDGKGFDAGERRPRGLGLLGMEERVRELGGSMNISSAAGLGAKIELRLPRPVTSGVPTDSDSNSGRSRDRTGRIEASA